jgi:acyl carrier protein
MDRQELCRILQGLVEETTGEPCPELDEAGDLREGLGLDSVDLFSLIVDMQGHFRVKIGGDEVERVRTVGELLDLLQAKLVAQDPQSSAA